MVILSIAMDDDRPSQWDPWKPQRCGCTTIWPMNDLRKDLTKPVCKSKDNIIYIYIYHMLLLLLWLLFLFIYIYILYIYNTYIYILYTHKHYIFKIFINVPQSHELFFHVFSKVQGITIVLVLVHTYAMHFHHSARQAVKQLLRTWRQKSP